MSQTSYLYRRHSGIYVVRISVPKCLKLQLSRSEIHVSTRCTDLRAAKALAFEVLRAWHLRFEELRRMDIVNISDAGGILEGEGFISLSNAAILFGLPKNQILRDVIDAGGAVYGELTGETGWRVNDPALLDRDYDNSIILNDVPNHGDMVVIKQALELANASAVPREYEKHPKLIWSEFIVPSQSHHRIFLVDDHPLTDQTILLTRRDLASFRERLLGCAGSDAIASERALRRAYSADHDPVAVASSSKAISELAEEYVRFQKQTRSWKRPNEQAQTIMRTVKLFIELLGDVTLDKITSGLLLEFRGHLETMPSDMAKARRHYGDIPLRNLIQQVHDDGASLTSQGKVELHLMRIGTVLGWGTKHGLLPKNPMETMPVTSRRKTKSNQDRLRFTDDDLRQLFSFECFKTGRGKRAVSSGRHFSFEPFHYWMPVLAYYTGARLGELCQLHLADFKVTDNGVHFIEITEAMDAVQSSRPEERMGPKSLKNKDSEREVPIHPELIRLGLLEYVGRLRSEGFRRLFPELTYSPMLDKRYTADVIRKFSGQKKQLDLGEDAARKSFHSYRHTFADNLCRTAKFEDVQMLIGHSVGQGQLEKRYFKGKRAAELLPVIEKLPELPVEVAPFDIADGLEAVLDCFGRRKKVHE